MISVDEVKGGVFQVVFTGVDLRMISLAAARIQIPLDDTLRGLLVFSVGVYSKALYTERSQDGLDRENEGMGRG